MSKAFLRESDEATEPEIPVPVATLPPGARNYITAAGAARLRGRLRRMRQDLRPPLAARAASDPDAKAQLAALDQQIRTLQQSLFGAEVVALTPGPTDVVRFGTTVTVRERDGTKADYRIVGVDETEPEHGAISWVSPLAQALMNAHVGTHVQAVTPAGPKDLEIVAIRYE